MRSFAVAVLAVVMLGSIFVLPRAGAAPPQPMTLYGVAQDALDPLVVGERITTFVDGADISNGTSIYSNPPNPWNYDVDSFGNWMTGVNSDTNNVSEGAMFGDQVMVVHGDMTTKGRVFKSAPIWVNGDNRILALTAATTQPGLLKIRSITVNPADTWPGVHTDYLYLCNPLSSPSDIDSGKYYLQKDAQGSYTGTRYPVAGDLPSIMIPPGGRMYVNLTSDTWFTATGDSLKLVYDNSGGDAFAGNDLIVDRVEFNATAGGNLEVPNQEPINTLMTNARMNPAPGREIRRILADCGQDTNDNFSDFGDQPETGRPGPNTPPTATVSSPVSTDSWTGGSTHAVQWNQFDAEDTQLTDDVKFSWAGSSFATNVFAGLSPLGLNSYNWLVPCVVPNTETLDAQVRVSVNDSAGAIIAAYGPPGAQRFSVDCLAPTVSMVPADGAVGVAVTTSLVLTFSEGMNTVASDAAVTLCLMPACNPPDILTHSGTWSVGNSVLTISPSAFLAPGAQYRATVACTALDDSSPGNPLAACPRTFTFTTAVAANPVFVLSYPKNTLGLDWTGGTTHPINWTQTYSNPATQLTAVLSYSTDGVSWTTITTTPPSPQGARSYSWTVPSINTLTARVRVCDVGNGTNCDGTLPADLFQIDSIAPTVTMNPANSAQNVAVGQPIVLTFSEAMNTGSVQAAFSFTPNPGGIVFTWSGTTMVTVSHQNFANCASVQVTLTTAAKDVSDTGNAIAAFSSTFNTVCAPTVTVTRPASTDRWTCGTTHNVVLTLADAGDSSLFLWVNVSMGAGFSPAPGFTPASYATSTTTLSFQVPTPVPAADVNNAIVRVTAQDSTRLDGVGSSVQFTIDCTPPTVTYSSPANNAQNVPSGAGRSFVIVFSEAINTATATSAFSLSPVVTGTLTQTWATNNNTMVTITHSAALAADTQYTLSISALLKDASDTGNAIVPTSIVFRTAVGVVADAGGPYSGQAGDAKDLDASGSTGAIVIYTWRIVKPGGAVVFVNATTAKTSYTFTDAGTYSITLLVIDASGNFDTDDTTASISAKAPPDFLSQYWWVLLILIAAILAAILFLVMGKRRKKEEEPEEEAEEAPKLPKSSAPPKSPPRSSSPPRASSPPKAAPAAAAAPAANAPNTMACPSCGTIVSSTDAECFMCGASLQ